MSALLAPVLLDALLGDQSPEPKRDRGEDDEERLVGCEAFALWGTPQN